MASQYTFHWAALEEVTHTVPGPRTPSAKAYRPSPLNPSANPNPNKPPHHKPDTNWALDPFSTESSPSSSPTPRTPRDKFTPCPALLRRRAMITAAAFDAPLCYEEDSLAYGQKELHQLKWAIKLGHEFLAMVEDEEDFFEWAGSRRLVWRRFDYIIRDD